MAMDQSEALSRGLWGVLATPFSEGAREVDEASLARLVQDQLEADAVGLVVLGVFGEGARLNTDERMHVLKAVRREAADTPLVVGISELQTDAAVTVSTQLLTALSGSSTPTTLMIQVPTDDSADLARHLRAVHDATGAGIVVQDYPIASGVTVSSEVLLSAVAQCPFVVAVKSEAPPTSVAVAELAAGMRTPVFGGLGGLGLLDELMAGAAGAMTGFSHPGVLGAVLRAWDASGYEQARATYLPWLPLVNFEAQVTVGLAIRKAALRERGVIANADVRRPGMAMPDTLLPLLRRHMAAAREEVLA